MPEAQNELRESADFELLLLTEATPGLFEETVRRRIEGLERELEQLQAKAGGLTREMEELAEPPAVQR